MKTHVLELHMAMTMSLIFSKNQVALIVARMVYVEVVLGVQVNWKTTLGS
jgi:hypothetical protein